METVEYIPYGKEWQAELMKWRKSQIIDFLKERLIELKETDTLTEENQKLKADYETINRFSIDQADLAVEQQTQINKLKEALTDLTKAIRAEHSNGVKPQRSVHLIMKLKAAESLLQTENKTE